MVDPVDVLRAHGGTARWGQLRGRVSRRRVLRAVTEGRVKREHGTYALPPTPRPTRLARRLRGVLSHRAAAEHWGFALPPLPDGVPESLDIAIGPSAQRRNVPDDVRLRYLDLEPTDVADDRVLEPVATVAFCLRDLSLRDALSVGDSALRSRRITHAQLKARVSRLRGRGAAEARRRVDLLDARAANAFESSCRALLLEAGTHGFRTQVHIRDRGAWIGCVDLAHGGWRIVIECDGFETHGSPAALRKDCVRHTLLVAAGWRPLRFTWAQVMYEPEWVVEQIRDTIALVAQPAGSGTSGSSMPASMA